MDWQYTPYILPLLVVAATSVALAYYARLHRNAPGATAFVLLVLAVAEWSLGYALELGATDLSTKIFWAKVEYLGIVTLPLTWLAFAMQYTRRDYWLTSSNAILLTIIPMISLILVWTNEAHGLIWRQIGLDRSGPFAALDLAYGPWFWVHSTYSYLLLLLGTAWLILMLLRSPHLYRQQAGALLLGVITPWVGNGLYLADLSPISNLDLTPFAFALSGLIFAWGLLRFRLLEIVPVARRAVVDGMSDGVIVLDSQNRVVDLNPVAQQIFGVSVSHTIGRPITGVMVGQAQMIEQLRNVREGRTEIALGPGDTQRHYDLQISPIADKRNRLFGRVVVLHDFTARKQAEQALTEQKQLFESLVAVARATVEQPTLKATLQNALDVATSLTGAQLGSLFLLDENGVVTHNISAFGQKTPAQELGFVSQVMVKGLAGWVARNCQAALVPNTAEDDRWLPLPNGYPVEVCSALVVPVSDGQRVLGVLNLTHATPGYFRAEHLDLMHAAVDQMALAVRNAQIFEAQRRLADHQITLYEVLRTVAKQTDPDHFGRVAVETITQFAGWSNVIIAVPDESKTHWKASAGSGALSSIAGQTFPMEQSVIGLAFKSAQTQLIPDVNDDPNYNVGSPTARSVLAIPLRRGQRTLGVLGLESDQPFAYDTDDVRLAESLAEAVALTLDNAQLYAETQKRLKEQTALRKASAVISSTLELESVLDHIAQQMGQAIDVTSAYIYNFDPEMSTSSILAWYVDPQAAGQEQYADPDKIYNLQKLPSFTELLWTGQPGHFAFDSPGLLKAERDHLQQFGTQMMLVIPLEVVGQVIGYAELRESRASREFTSDEIALCQSIAQQAAIAIQNARLFDETHENAVGLSTLYTVTRMVGQSLVLEDVFPKALASVLISLGFEAGAINLADPNGGRLHLAAEHRLPSTLASYFEEDGGGSTLVQHIYAQQEVLAISDLSREASVEVSELVAQGFRGYVGIPLLHRDQSLGVMSLLKRQPHRASAEDLALLSTLGNQVAVALANARLFQTINDQHGRLQALIEASRDAVLLIGMDQRVLVTNVLALKFLGLEGTPEDWTDRPIMEVLNALRHRSRVAVRMALTEMRRIRQGNESSAEGEFTLSSRSIQWQNLPVLADSNPLGRLIVLRDVTEERQLEKLRDDLTHTMVHDLRNPLTAISGSLELINMFADNLLPDQQRMLEIARNRTRGMMKLVSGILDVSRLESGQMLLQRTPLSMADLVEETLQAQSPLAVENDLNLVNDVSPTLPPICADAALIERVLQNLVGNAIKFTSAGGRVKVSVRPIDAAKAGQTNGLKPRLRVSVSDTGPGIPPELQDQLFQKFATGRQEKSGSGLGLAFCKLAVEAHGGQIWVESEPNQGATFNFTLPIISEPSCYSDDSK